MKMLRKLLGRPPSTTISFASAYHVLDKWRGEMATELARRVTPFSLRTSVVENDTSFSSLPGLGPNTPRVHPVHPGSNGVHPSFAGVSVGVYEVSEVAISSPC